MIVKYLLGASLTAIVGLIATPPLAAVEPNSTDAVEIAASNHELAAVAKAITVQVHVDRHKGSGILIAKDNSTYTVVTNAHVVNRGETIVVETPDGVKHTASSIGETDTEQDLAVVQFDSSNDYRIAEIGSSDDLSQGDAVVAAGFPYNSTELKITTGEISLLPDKSL